MSGSTCDSALQTNLNKTVLLGVVLLNQLMYFNTLVLISATATKAALL